MVAAQQIAADIGLDVLKSGGNAIDTALATGLAPGVVDQFNSGIDGGRFIVIRMVAGATSIPLLFHLTSCSTSRNSSESDLARISYIAISLHVTIAPACSIFLSPVL